MSWIIYVWLTSEKDRDRQTDRQMNGWTDFATASAALYYVARPKLHQQWCVREWLSCSHSFPTPIESFPFPFPPIPIPVVSSDYYTLKSRNIGLYFVSWIQNKIWSYSRSIVNQTHHSSVIIIITITAYHCSLFNVYQTVTACYCAKTAGCSHCRWTTMEI